MRQNNSNFKSQFQNGWNVALNGIGKFAEQKHMSALRDGFALLVPLLLLHLLVLFVWRLFLDDEIQLLLQF